MQLFDFNFNEPTLPTAEEFARLTWPQYVQTLRRHQKEYQNRSKLERAVLSIRRRIRHAYCIVWAPGLAICRHLPAKTARALLAHIASGRWWLIGPDAWLNWIQRQLHSLIKEIRHV